MYEYIQTLIQCNMVQRPVPVAGADMAGQMILGNEYPMSINRRSTKSQFIRRRREEKKPTDAQDAERRAMKEERAELNETNIVELPPMSDEQLQAWETFEGNKSFDGKDLIRLAATMNNATLIMSLRLGQKRTTTILNEILFVDTFANTNHGAEFISALLWDMALNGHEWPSGNDLTMPSVWKQEDFWWYHTGTATREMVLKSHMWLKFNNKHNKFYPFQLVRHFDVVMPLHALAALLPFAAPEAQEVKPGAKKPNIWKQQLWIRADMEYRNTRKVFEDVKRTAWRMTYYITHRTLIFFPWVTLPTIFLSPPSQRKLIGEASESRTYTHRHAYM